jgi:hypothetical protein
MVEKQAQKLCEEFCSELQATCWEFRLCRQQEHRDHQRQGETNSMIDLHPGQQSVHCQFEVMHRHSKWTSCEKATYLLIIQVLWEMCAKLQDVITRVILRKKCYINIHPIVNCYIATSILMYIYGRKWKFHNTVQHEKKFMCQIIPQTKDID